MTFALLTFPLTHTPGKPRMVREGPKDVDGLGVREEIMWRIKMIDYWQLLDDPMMNYHMFA